MVEHLEEVEMEEFHQEMGEHMIAALHLVAAGPFVQKRG